MKTVEVYMCKIDWDYEIGEARGGSTVYGSEEDLKLHHDCVDECGVVKVKMSLVEVIKPGKSWGAK